MTLLFTTLTPDSLPSFTSDLLGTLDEIDEDRKKKAEEKEAGVGREQEKEDNKGKKSRSETYSNLRIIFCIT